MTEALRILNQVVDYIDNVKPVWGDELKKGLKAAIDVLDEGNMSPTEINELLDDW